jgi:predicted dehydrogenase
VTALRFAVVGAGAIAQAYAQALGAAEDVTVVSVVDPRGEAAAALAEPFGATALADVSELDGVDAAVVCTPPATHADVCTALLGNGVAVLCEKPLAVDSVAAQRIVAASRASGAALSMASKFRYVPDVVQARSLVIGGLLGEVVWVESVFSSSIDMSKRWNSDPAISGGGVVIDNGTHSADIVRYLVGPVTEVLAVETRHAEGLAVEDTATLLLRTASGVQANVTLSWTVDRMADHYLVVTGHEGALEVGWRQSRYKRRTSTEWVEFGNGYDKIAAFRHQIDNFAGMVRGSEESLVSHEDALASVAVIEAAYASLRDGGRWTPVAS